MAPDKSCPFCRALSSPQGTEPVTAREESQLIIRCSVEAHLRPGVKGAAKDWMLLFRK